MCKTCPALSRDSTKWKHYYFTKWPGTTGVCVLILLLSLVSWQSHRLCSYSAALGAHGRQWTGFRQSVRRATQCDHRVKFMGFSTSIVLKMGYWTKSPQNPIARVVRANKVSSRDPSSGMLKSLRPRGEKVTRAWVEGEVGHEAGQFKWTVIRSPPKPTASRHLRPFTLGLHAWTSGRQTSGNAEDQGERAKWSQKTQRRSA